MGKPDIASGAGSSGALSGTLMRRFDQPQPVASLERLGFVAIAHAAARRPQRACSRAHALD
jgi:hypothetical protein